MSTETCQHEEFVDYVGMRKLGWCRKCGRVMEYDPTGGGERPHDVTAEFQGRNPFTEEPAFERHRITINGRSPDTGPERHAPSFGRSPVLHSAITRRGTPNTVKRAEYYEANREAIMADMRTMTREDVMEKWGIPYSMYYELSRRWKAPTPERPKAEPSRRSKQGNDRLFVRGKAGKGAGRNNMARQRYYLQHKDEIIADVHDIGATATRKKWGVPSSTFSHHLRVWGVAVPPEKQCPRQPTYYDERREAIEADMKAMPLAGTQQTYRRFRNTLFFLVADQDRTQRMLHNARRWLALEILTKDKQRLSNYKLSTEHQQRLNEWKGTADLEATISITRAYHDLFYPADSSDSRYKQLAHQPLHVESQGDTRGNQTELVLKALRDLGKVKSADDSPMAPALVKRDAFGKDEGRIKTAALFERFAERVKLPLFLEPTYLKTIIAAGVKSKEWIYYDITKDMGYDSAEDLPYIVIDENHEVLLPELAARETIRLYRKAEPQEQPPKPLEVKERPPGTSISESGEPRRLMTDLATKATDAGWKAVTKVDIQWKGSGLETLARLKAVQTIKGRLAGAGLWLRTAEFSCQHNDGSEIAVTYKGTPAGFGTVVSMAEQQIKGATKSFASVALEVTYEPRIAIDGPDFDDLRDLLELADTGTTDMTIWKSDD